MDEQNVTVELSPVEQLDELRKNSVSKEEYDKVVAERNQMFATLTKQPRTVQPEEPKITQADRDKRMAELRHQLYGEECQLNNLEYWKATLELRDNIIESGGKDPFLPYGEGNAVDENDQRVVQRVVDGVQHCIDYADGDSAVFTNELQRITVDDPTARMAARRG